MDWLLVLTVLALLIVGFGIGWRAKASAENRAGARDLNELVTYLHLKRALAPIEPRPVAPGPEVTRVRSAVIDVREKLVETLAQVHARSGANPILMRMAAACTRYLRVTAGDPENYQFELAELRRNLDEDLRILTDGRRDVLYRSPGEAPARKRKPPPSSAGRIPAPGAPTSRPPLPKNPPRNGRSPDLR